MSEEAMLAAVDVMSMWRQGAAGSETAAAVADVMPVAENEEIDICLLDSEDD